MTKLDRQAHRTCREAGRCLAAMPADSRPCEGEPDEVRVFDQTGQEPARACCTARCCWRSPGLTHSRRGRVCAAQGLVTPRARWVAGQCYRAGQTPVVPPTTSGTWRGGREQGGRDAMSFDISGSCRADAPGCADTVRRRAGAAYPPDGDRRRPAPRRRSGLAARRPGTATAATAGAAGVGERHRDGAGAGGAHHADRRADDARWRPTRPPPCDRRHEPGRCPRRARARAAAAHVADAAARTGRPARRPARRAWTRPRARPGRDRARTPTCRSGRRRPAARAHAAHRPLPRKAARIASGQPRSTLVVTVPRTRCPSGSQVHGCWDAGTWCPGRDQGRAQRRPGGGPARPAARSLP